MHDIEKDIVKPFRPSFLAWKPHYWTFGQILSSGTKRTCQPDMNKDVITLNKEIFALEPGDTTELA